MLTIGKMNLPRSKILALFVRNPANLKFYLQRKFKAGFTFIELVLVSIIIMVLVGLSAPVFKKPFNKIQLKNTSQDIAQLMRYLQTKAIAERRLYRINFDYQENIFWPTAQSQLHPADFEKMKERQGKTKRLADGLSLEGETSFITFYPDGSSDKAKIVISDTSGESLSICTQKHIGYVKVEE